MNIAVCVKRVPHTNTRIRIADSGDAIDPADVELTLGPYDEFALELALRLKDEHKAKVTVVCLDPGGPATQKLLRDCLAKGADQALLLTADTGIGGAGADAFAVARALADALADGGHDLVLFGYKAVDDDASQVGAMTATLLERACATEVVELAPGDGKVTATRLTEGGTETVELTLPAVATIQKTPHELRVAKMKDIMMAKKKPLEEKAVELRAPKLKVTKLAFPPEREAGRKLEGADAVPEVVAYIKDELKLL